MKYLPMNLVAAGSSREIFFREILSPLRGEGKIGFGHSNQ
jgi:hypothetical protein